MTQPERCRTCGDVRDPATPSGLAWMTDRATDGRASSMCPSCARIHLRSIESKLPDEYF